MLPEGYPHKSRHCVAHSPHQNCSSSDVRFSKHTPRNGDHRRKHEEKHEKASFHFSFGFLYKQFPVPWLTLNEGKQRINQHCNND